MTSGRQWTAIDRIAEVYLDDSVALDPLAATEAGLPGHDHRLPELDPAWYEERSRLRRRTLAALAAARHWLQLREQAGAAAGAQFDLKSFHRRVLDIGSLGLDVLRAAISESPALGI